MSIRVTVEDTETGDVDTAVVEDYLLIVADPSYLAGRVAHPNGTHILTVKAAHRPPAETITTWSADRHVQHLLADEDTE